MSVRSAVSGALRPVLGPDRLAQLRRTERRWRRRAARRLDPGTGRAGRSGPARARAAAGPAAPPAFPEPTLSRHDLLTGLHRVIEPRGYLEVGVNDGRSLTLARCPSIGIDPAFKVTSELCCPLHLVRATSDEFFDRPDPLEHLPGALDLAFIDGMHLAEFAYRDFFHLEPLLPPTGVIVLDDMLPRDVPEAARDRHTLAWAGDVYKVAELLGELRPDLVVIPVNTSPTGVVVVLGLDPGSTVLADAYQDRLAELTAPDPQAVPERVLTRAAAADAAALLADPVWARLRALREHGASPEQVREALAPLRAG